MARRRSRNGHADYGHYSVTVSASSASISHRILDPKYDASSTITIEGALVTPVIRRQAALVYVHCREQGHPGGALGVNDTHWQVLVYLPRPQFVDLLMLVAAQRIARVELLTDVLRRGSGSVRSAGFHTAHVPSEGARSGLRWAPPFGLWSHYHGLNTNVPALAAPSSRRLHRMAQPCSIS